MIEEKTTEPKIVTDSRECHDTRGTCTKFVIEGFEVCSLCDQFYRTPRPRYEGLKEIERTVCRVGEIDPAILHDGTATRPRTDARHIICTLAYKFTDLSLDDIGGYYERRTHATVLNNIRVFHNLYESNREFNKWVESVLFILDLTYPTK